MSRHRNIRNISLDDGKYLSYNFFYQTITTGNLGILYSNLRFMAKCFKYNYCRNVDTIYNQKPHNSRF